MKKNLVFIICVLSTTIMIGCGSGKEESKKESDESDKTEEPAEESNAQSIETPGYEGTIEGPSLVTIRNHNFSDAKGNTTKFPLIDIDENTAFTIEKTTKTLDSLRAEVEKSSFDKFIDYAEEGDDYFIARAMGMSDTLYILGFVIAGPDGNYKISQYSEFNDAAPLKTILEYARTYKRK